ncbi:hypothetical protein WDU94_003305 [Cyamophila willieti]
MESLYAILTSIIFLIIVILTVIIGWYLVWKLFLSRFRFVRELFEAKSQEKSSSTQPRRSKRVPVKKE